MVGEVRGVDDDVINVDLAKLVELLEKEVRGPLERRGCVAQPEGHDAELEGTITGLEGSSFAVFGYHLNLVEPAAQVHFGEHARTSHAVQALVNAWHWVDHFHCELV